MHLSFHSFSNFNIINLRNMFNIIVIEIDLFEKFLERFQYKQIVNTQKLNYIAIIRHKTKIYEPLMLKIIKIRC